MALAQSERGLLARVGFFLCRAGEAREAEAVFSGLAGAAPEKDGPAVGLALCWIVQGRNDEAVALLDRRLEKGSVIAPALRLYKLLALGMAGRLGEARKLREEMERGGLDEAVRTADRLLEELSRQAAR